VSVAAPGPSASLVFLVAGLLAPRLRPKESCCVDPWGAPLLPATALLIPRCHLEQCATVPF
jgi:hypothetical protein